jgi:type II secretory pathway component PulM
MKSWFSQFNQREQLSLLVLGFALALYLLYMLVWSPLASQRDQLEVQNRGVAASLQRVDAMVSEVLQLRAAEGGSSAGARRNLTSLINQSTRRLQLAVTRLQPNSRGEIQVRFEAAAFDDLLQWLHEMESVEGLLVREASITQAGSSGRVNATVRLAQAG